MTVTKTGGKVLWHELERADLGDIDAIGDLAAKAVADSTSVIVGADSNTSTFTVNNQGRFGLCSRLVYDGTTPGAVTFEPFKFMTVTRTANNEGHSIGYVSVCEYERVSLVGQARSTPSLNFGAHVGRRPYVWARRRQDPLGETPANRRFWDELTTAEVTDSVNTRIADYVELALSPVGADTTPPTSSSDWVVIARAQEVSGFSVFLEPRFFLDLPDETFESSDTNLADGRALKFYAEDRGGTPSIPEAFTALFAALSKVRDGRWPISGGTFRLSDDLDPLLATEYTGWNSDLSDTTFQGLVQITERTDDLEATLDPINTAWPTVVGDVSSATADTLRVKSSLPLTAPLLVGKVDTNAAVFSYSYALAYNPVASLDWSGQDGELTITFRTDAGMYINQNNAAVFLTAVDTGPGSRRWVQYVWQSDYVLTLTCKETNGAPIHGIYSVSVLNCSMASNPWLNLNT